MKRKLWAFAIWALFLAAMRAQAAYIIVHAHNPEGVEIASIQGMGPHWEYSVGIYDGEWSIGHGASSAENHNKPIWISSGTHIIKVKFNGMTKEQTVTLTPNETKILAKHI